MSAQHLPCRFRPSRGSHPEVAQVGPWLHCNRAADRSTGCHHWTDGMERWLEGSAP